jgi:energy-coupling factor transporter transmembrane protein EcfT
MTSEANSKRSSSRLADDIGLSILVILCLFLIFIPTELRIIPILLVSALAVSFSGRKPYRKGFIVVSVVAILYLIYPISFGITRGNCLTLRTCRIVYGLPTLEARERARRGEVVLGGCVITPASPRMEIQLSIP